MSDGWDDLAPVDGPGPGAPEGGGGGPEPAPDEAMREALRKGAALPLNDLGNGERFALHFGRDVMFVPRVGWFVWGGRRWEKDPDELAVRRRAQRLSALILQEVDHLPISDAEAGLLVRKEEVAERVRVLSALPAGERSADQVAELTNLRGEADRIAALEKRLGERRGQHRRFGVSTGNSARIGNAMIEGGVQLAVPFEALDADPLALNTESGVLRFSLSAGAESGDRVAEVRLEPHARDQKVTKIAPVTLDPDARAPRFEAFLEQVLPDPDVRGFLQRWFGLSLLGLPEQRLVFLYGSGANGKSVLVDLIARVAGEYAATARIESLTGSRRAGGGDATPDLIPLMGARMVRTSEPDEGQRLQEGLIKELTGGEPMLVRALMKDFIEVRPIFKLTMSGNHKPEIRGTDDGIWRRVLLVPFEVQIAESERDPALGEKLWAERAGVLNWLVDGIVELLERGLDPPAAVREATAEYREESDPIGQFLAECCVVTGDPADVIGSAELGQAFALFLMERGQSPWKPTTFARQMPARARHWRDAQGRQFAKGKSSRSQYECLRLTDAFRRRLDAAPKDQSGRVLGVGTGVSPDPSWSDFPGG